MNLTKTKKNEFFKLLLRTWWNNKIFALLTIIFSSFVVFLLVINVKLVEWITAILISKNIVDLFNNTPNLEKLFDILGLDKNLIPIFSNKINNETLEKIIHEFYFKYINYDGNDLYKELLGLKLNMLDLCYCMVGSIVFVVLFTYFAYMTSGAIAANEEMKLRNSSIKALLKNDLDYFNVHKSGDLISVVVKDTQIIGMQLKNAPVVIYQVFTTIFFSIVIMTTIDWKLSVIVYGLLLSIIVLVSLIIFINKKNSIKLESFKSDINSQVSEKINLMELIKASGTWDSEIERFENLNKQNAKKTKNNLWLNEMSTAILVGGVGCFAMATLIFGVVLYNNEMQRLLSIITSFTTGVIIIVLPVLQLKDVLATLNISESACTNIKAVINSKPNIKMEGKKTFRKLDGDIVFKNVSFSYPNKEEEIISNLSLSLKQGKKYAFVGKTGSGKSTITKLLLRFYDPTKGEILLNYDQPLKSFEMKSWLDQVGYVGQEPQILSGNIFENVRYVKYSATDEEIIEACKKAKLHDLIMSWPEQYNTVLFEKGSQLSGGQKQRLVIARMFVKNPQVLVLDEATSALDNIVEKEIQMELEKLMVGRTTISIAHRLSTIKSFDKIFVIEPKRGIVQEGTFNELSNTPGVFKTLNDISNN